MNPLKQIVAVILLVLSYCATPLVGHAQEKSDRDDAAAANDAQNSNDNATTKEAPSEPELVPLTIGSPAPELDIEHWIQDGNGHFAKVSDFEQGKVYVVEFWATWCGPCIAAMPHIAQLQKSYADRGVQVVSITRESAETVDRFLERPLPRDEEADEETAEKDAEPQTYRDLTSVYCLTADPDGSTSRDYMEAAGRTGIPCAFIVGKDSRIEWIGHPIVIDKPLEQIVTDTWDRDAFIEEYAAEQKAREVLSQVSALMRAKKTAEAVAVLDDYIANGKIDSEQSRFRTIKFQVLVADKNFAEEAAQCAREVLADKSLDASGVNNIAWMIYQYAAADRLQNEELLQQALDASQRVVGDAGAVKPLLLDTVAHLQYQLGDAEQALQTQQSAIESADLGTRKRLQGFLDELEREIKASKEAEVAGEKAEPVAEK